MDGFFDNLAAKYAEPEKGSKRKRGKAAMREEEEEEVQESPKKRARKGVPPPPGIDDEEFEKLQKKLFSDKAKPSSKGEATETRGKRGSKGRKAK